MPIDNQVSHRASFLKRKAAGKVATNPKSGIASPPIAHKRKPLDPNAPRRSLGVQLGLLADEPAPRRAPAQQPVPAPVALPLPAIVPNANVPETATPETVVDPPSADEQLKVTPDSMLGVDVTDLTPPSRRLI